MNCQEFWDSMPELGGADERHLRECAVCAARMSRQQELAAGLRAMADSYRRVEAPARLESRLRTAFRRENGAGVEWGVRSGWALALPWAAAVVLVIALAAFMIGGRQPDMARPVEPHGTELAMTVNTDAQSEYEGFIALPNAAKLADTEDVNLVRVQVPRSAMIALGLDVSPERASELVDADVILGPDGLARAVRFLDSDSL